MRWRNSRPNSASGSASRGGSGRFRRFCRACARDGGGMLEPSCTDRRGGPHGFYPRAGAAERGEAGDLWEVLTGAAAGLVVGRAGEFGAGCSSTRRRLGRRRRQAGALGGPANRTGARSRNASIAPPPDLRVMDALALSLQAGRGGRLAQTSRRDRADPWTARRRSFTWRRIDRLERIGNGRSAGGAELGGLGASPRPAVYGSTRPSRASSVRRPGVSAIQTSGGAKLAAALLLGADPELDPAP